MKQFIEINTLNINRAEWLELRRKGIGGSDAGAILDVNKWKTPFEVYIDKVDPVIEEEQSEASYFGTRLESLVAEEFEIRTGKKVRRNNRMMISTEYPFMLANIDREIVGENAILECKTANAYLLPEWENGNVPASYIIQGQHYLSVTGKSAIYYAVLIGGQKFKWIKIERDDDLIKMIIEAEKGFWENHVLKKIPPALDGSTSAEKLLKERFEKAENGKTVDLLSDYTFKIDKYLNLKEQIKDLENQAGEIENNIKFEMADAETGLTKDYVIKWKNVKSSRFDNKKFKSDYPELSAKYTYESNSRRFTINKITEDK